ncbi:Imm7 family immunity protein [Nocardia suismassiliense]|uniref:Imm7 family immunity protein n=1 Tax=Nocardia suismassiliense TaxID=2077092 RepID=A0ABW6R5J4_9NOCA
MRSVVRKRLWMQFQVIVMRRGKVSVETDTLLSPCVPVIEDEDE